MKKALLLLIFFFFLTSCETAQEKDMRKKEEEIEKITEEIEKQDVPEEIKQWLIDNKVKNVITILCLSTSRKCNALKIVSDEIAKEYDLSIYYNNLDELKDNVISILKTTYELNDYTGYMPYIYIINTDKLLSTHTDTFSKEEFIEYLKQNKIISEVSTTD